MRIETKIVKLVGVLVALAVTQIIGWGSVMLLTVVGRDIAADLGMELSAVFAGSSVFYVIMGLISPVMARPLSRFGARWVMLAGSAVSAPAFVLMAFADGPIPYFLSWALLGAAGSAGLNTAAYVLVSEIAGTATRWAISALMLATGLASSIFWPVTAALSTAFDWRGAALIFAGLIAFVSIPIEVFALPRKQATPAVQTPADTPTGASPLPRRIFWLLSAAIVFNAFVTFGLSTLFVELLKGEGLAAAEAVALASLLGVLQVAARLIHFFAARRWDEITTALIAGIGLILALILLLFASGSHVLVLAFVGIYGLGSGALAVARATMPLVFFDKADFARAIARIALPLNIISAIAPPVFAALLTASGSAAVLGLALGFSVLALAALIQLARLRRRFGLAETAPATPVATAPVA